LLLDDKIFFGVLIYLVLSTMLSAMLPTSFYSGTKFVPVSSDDLVSGYNVSEVSAVSPVEQLNFMQKILSYFFVTWKINGIPLLIANLIFLLNIITVVVGAVWVYDKLRGI